MNFVTVTKSGMFQYVQRDSTKSISVSEVEYDIVQKFNKQYSYIGITLVKYSHHLPFAFMIVAESKYSGSRDNNREHPHYDELVLSTGYLTSICNNYDLECTRRGT